MLHKSFKPTKCKTALKLAASRIKLLKNKKEVQIKQVRREVAQLLESGQVQTARIRVEHVIKEEKTMGAYELIEIYCELIAARLPIIESQKNCPIDLKEAIASVVFASPRSADIPELMDVRKHFLAKYGKDFISAAVELRPDCGVNRSLVEKLSAKTSDGPTKMKMLTAITEEHNIKWDPNSFGGKDGPSQDDLLKGPSTFDKASRLHEEPSNVHTSPIVDVGSQNTANDEDSKNFHARTSFGHQNIRRYPERVISPVNSHLETQSSANIREGSEARCRRHLGDASMNYMGRPDWNMEFTDATAAAQAATESAERVSMAARAAAELSSRGKATAHYAPDSHGFREEQLERPSGLRPPGEVPSRTQVNNASVARKFGRPDEHIDSREENSARDQNGQNDPRKTNPEVGSKFHGVHVGGVVAVDNTVGSEAPDTCSNQGDNSDDNDSLSGMTKKLYRDAYKKSSNSYSPEHQAAGKYTETYPWSTELDHDCISDEQSGRKNSFEEVNISASSEIIAGKDSSESFVDYAPDMQETYGSIKDSRSFTKKQVLSSLDERKLEDGLGENLFAYDDGKRISMGNKTTGEGAVVFDDYGSDENVENVFDLDKGPKSSHTSSLPHVEAHLLEDSGIPSPGRIMADSFKMRLAENVPEAEAAPEMEENLPVTFDDSDGLSSENEVEPKKSRAPRDSEQRSGVQKTSHSSEFAPVGEAEAVSNSGSMLAFGNLTGGRRNKSHLPPIDDHRFSSSNAASTDKVSDEGTDIHYGDGQVEGRPNRRMQTNAVSHEVTVPPPKTGARPIVFTDDEEEFVLDADYWTKSSTRPVANDYVEKNRLSSRNSRQSDSDGKIDIAKEHQPRLLSGKSCVGSAAGLSRRTKRGNQRDAEDLGFSLRNAVVGENSVKLRAQANVSNRSESYGRLKWRSETKDDQVSEPSKASVKETGSSSPSRPSLDLASSEDSFTQANHVHPKMPQDYESLLANLESLRANSKAQLLFMSIVYISTRYTLVSICT